MFNFFVVRKFIVIENKTAKTHAATKTSLQFVPRTAKT